MKVSLRMEDAFCRSRCNVGVNKIAAGRPSLIEDTNRF